jgi:dolichyl-phosphate beta-glucosyltransferase
MQGVPEHPYLRQEDGVRVDKPFLSVVIAAYNEAGIISDTVQRIAGYLHEKYPYEIVVVDDGSSDNTLEILKEMESRFAALRVIRNGANEGKGSAVKKGVLAARGEFILFTDADLAYSIEDAEDFRRAVQEGVDAAIGSRVHPGSLYSMHARYFPYIFQRHLIGRIFIMLVNLLFGLEISDTQCGFKVFRADAARDIFLRTTMMDFSIDVEVCCIARRLGYRIQEMPVHFRYNGGKSSVRIIISSFRMMVDLIRIRNNLSRGLYDRAGVREAVP